MMKAKSTIYAKFKSQAEHPLILLLCSLATFYGLAAIISKHLANQAALAQSLVQLDTWLTQVFVGQVQAAQDLLDMQRYILQLLLDPTNFGAGLPSAISYLASLPAFSAPFTVYGVDSIGLLSQIRGPPLTEPNIFRPKEICRAKGLLESNVSTTGVTQCLCLPQLNSWACIRTAYSVKANPGNPLKVFILGLDSSLGKLQFTNWDQFMDLGALLNDTLKQTSSKYMNVTTVYVYSFVMFVKSVVAAQGKLQSYKLQISEDARIKRILDVKVGLLEIYRSALPASSRPPLVNYSANIYLVGVPDSQAYVDLYDQELSLRASYQQFGVLVAAAAAFIVVVAQQVFMRVVLALLEFYKFYDQLLRAACDSTEYGDLYALSIKKYSWAQERSFPTQLKQALVHLRSFLWLVCNYPALQYAEFPFKSQKLSESCLREGMAFFRNKREQLPYYHVSGALSRLLEGQHQYERALQVVQQTAERTGANLGWYEQQYSEEEEELRELIQETVFRMYRNYLTQLALICKWGRDSLVKPGLLEQVEGRLADLQLRYNVIPELQLEGLLLRIRVSRIYQRDCSQLIVQATKFFNKVASKKSPSRPYSEIKEMHRLKQTLHYQIICSKARDCRALPSPQLRQALKREIISFFSGQEAFQGPGLIAVKYRTKPYFSPQIRCEVLKLMLEQAMAPTEKDVEYIERALRFFSLRKRVVVMLDCSEPLKEQSLLRLMLKTIGRALGPSQSLLVYFFADTYVKYMGEQKEKLQAISVSEMLREMEQSNLRSKERRTIDCFTRVLREQEQSDCATYFIMYLHELYPGGNQHLYQSSRRAKDRYIDLCLMVHNSFCHLLVASSLRRSRSDSYSPDKLSFDALDFHFLNGDNDLEIEQEFEDFLL